jgi:hypothetical protein
MSDARQTKMSASCSICEKFETAWNKGDLLSRLVLGVGTTLVMLQKFKLSMEGILIKFRKKAATI